MSKATCYYFVTDSGRAPVREFIDSLDPKAQRKFFFVKGLLEEFGYQLLEPHAKYIGHDIFELRFVAILTNGFIKKSNKTPGREKHLAMERRKIFLSSQK